jgi:predicted ArsR family transcriptional regulator
MKTVRQRLLEYLEQRQRATALDLSQALKMTSANARHHLEILRSEGVVEVVGTRKAHGRGRPAQLYGIRQAEQAHNLERLSSALLDELLNELTPVQSELVLQRVASRLAGNTASSDGAGKLSRNPARRLSELVLQLNRMHYQARWEAHADSPRMLLNHCPYAALLTDHPELCRLDAFFLEAASGFSARQIARLEPNSLGGKQCIFALHRA